MFKKILYITLGLVTLLAFTETPVLNRILTRYKTFSRYYHIQKIYVHTDKDVYSTGEHIWFKVYLLDDNHHLDTISKMAYVELISPNGALKEVRILKLKNGIGYGDITLNDTMLTGLYELRAYTNLMKNFGERFFFRKTIKIQNSNPQFSEIPEPLYLEMKFIKSKKHKIITHTNFNSDNLIVGTQNTIFIRTADYLNKPLVTNVKIVCGNRTIAETQTDSLGLAKLTFTPELNCRYKLIITHSNYTTRIKLPKPVKTGYQMSISDTLNFLKIKLKTIHPKTNDKNFKTLYLLAERNGKIYYLTYETIDDSTTIYVSKKKLPEGIVHFVLFNGYGKPVLDQIAFVKPVKTVHPALLIQKLDSTHYRLIIKTDTNISASLSLSVTGQSSKKQTQTIYDYLNIKSDIPEFPDTKIPDNSSLNPEINAFRWTRYTPDFIWSQTTVDSPKFYVQNSLYVSGTITKLFFDIPVKHTKVRLTILNSYNDVFTTYTDKNGRFVFSGLNYPDSMYILVEAWSKRGTKNVLVNIDRYDTIPTNFKPVSNLHTKLKWKQMKLTKKDEWKPGAYTLHSNVDQVFYMKDYPALGNQNVLEFLKSRVPGYVVEDGKARFRGYSSILGKTEPLYLVDDVPVSVETVKELNIDDVERIEIIKNRAYSAIYGSRGVNGVIAIYTKQGHHVIRGRWETTQPGYYTPRPFSPLPLSELQKVQNPTYYWKPDIRLTKGKAVITFWLPQGTSTVNLDLQGVGFNGEILSARKKISIKK